MKLSRGHSKWSNRKAVEGIYVPEHSAPTEELSDFRHYK